MDNEIKTVLTMIDQLKSMASELDKVENNTNIRSSASIYLSQTLGSLNQYVKTLSNPERVSKSQAQKALSELKRQAVKDGRTIDVKRIEIKDLVMKIKTFKSQYQKEVSPEEKSFLQSRIKSASNLCAKKHKELKHEKQKYNDKLLEQRLGRI